MYAKNSETIIKLKEKTEKDLTVSKTETILGKYKICPKCKATIDKFEGYNFKKKKNLNN